MSNFAKEQAGDLFSSVYEELRRIAAAQMNRLPPAGSTLQPTALVHEVWLRLGAGRLDWQSQAHFFAAAAEAMRRILVEQARRKKRSRHGGGRRRVDLDTELCVSSEPDDSLVALDEALERLAKEDPQSAELVKLRYFAGLTIPQTAEILGVSPRKANFIWSFARAWLRREMEQP